MGLTPAVSRGSAVLDWAVWTFVPAILPCRGASRTHGSTRRPASCSGIEAFARDPQFGQQRTAFAELPSEEVISVVPMGSLRVTNGAGIANSPKPAARPNSSFAGAGVANTKTFNCAVSSSPRPLRIADVLSGIGTRGAARRVQVEPCAPP